MHVAIAAECGVELSVEQVNQIDMIGIDRDSGDVVLTITDHLDWSEPSDTHLRLLQAKLNAYLRFVESGELLDRYPNSKGRGIVIYLVGKFGLSGKARRFVDEASTLMGDAGIKLQFERLE